MEYLQSLCLKIVRNEVDHFEVISAGGKLGVDFSEAKGFLHEKYLLQHAVLTELLKSSREMDTNYAELYSINTKLLNLKKVRKPAGYPCFLVGCLFRGRRHRHYVKHLETIHPSTNEFPCSYNHRCLRNFSSVDELKDHVKSLHYDQRGNEMQTESTENLLEMSCKCIMVSCGEMVFQSIRNLATHMNTTHKKEPRECIFLGCGAKFAPHSVSRNHFCIKHFKPKQTILKPVHILNQVPIGGYGSTADEQGIVLDSTAVGQDIDMLNESESQEEDFENDIENSDQSDPEDGDPPRPMRFNPVEGGCSRGNQSTETSDIEVENFFLMSYADFLNRLINYKFIPISSVHEIAAEFFNQSRRSAQARESVLRRSLSKISNLDPELLEQIVKESSNDPFMNAQEELSTEFKRKQFMEENFKYVKPREIVLNEDETKLGASKDVVHYVPILDALKVLIEDKSFVSVLEDAAEEEKIEKKDIILDVKDGNAYKTNKFFNENPSAFALMLYSDGVELTNPLSSGKGKHKIVQLFWTLCDIPRFQRSTIDRLQLGLVFKEKLLKKYSHSQIFKCIVDDFSVLEVKGVEVIEPIPRHVKAGVLLYSADNLEVGVNHCAIKFNIFSSFCKYNFYSPEYLVVPCIWW